MFKKLLGLAVLVGLVFVPVYSQVVWRNHDIPNGLSISPCDYCENTLFISVTQIGGFSGTARIEGVDGLIGTVSGAGGGQPNGWFFVPGNWNPSREIKVQAVWTATYPVSVQWFFGIDFYEIDEIMAVNGPVPLPFEWDVCPAAFASRLTTPIVVQPNWATQHSIKEGLWCRLSTTGVSLSPLPGPGQTVYLVGFRFTN